jgi:hypothetical protein
MITKVVAAYGRMLTLTCDNNCEKAFGIRERPYIQLDGNVDNIAWLSDDEVGIAPIDPGTDEGGHRKPTCEKEKLNKWCFRQCERCSEFNQGEEVIVKSFDKRVYNIDNNVNKIMSLLETYDKIFIGESDNRDEELKKESERITPEFKSLIENMTLDELKALLQSDLKTTYFKFRIFCQAKELGL